MTHKEKIRLLLGLLERDQPENALIFTNMKSTAVDLAKRLSHNGFPAEYIMGDLPQRKRLKLIKDMKEGRIRLLVATDVAARGLHIQDLDLVVNYDVPEDYELYVHRIGRTARAGKTGKAITLACERYVYGLEAIESFIGQKIPVVWPAEGLFKHDAGAGMRFFDRSARSTSSRSRTPERSGGTRTGRKQPSKRAEGTQSVKRTPAKSSTQAVPKKPHPSNAKSGSTKSGGSPRNGERTQPPRRVAPPVGKPSGNASIEDRLSYYSRKYGEEFQVNRDRSGKAGSRKNSGTKRNGASQPAQRTRNPEGSRPARADEDARGNGSGKDESKSLPREARGEAAAHEGPGFVGKLKRLFKRH